MPKRKSDFKNRRSSSPAARVESVAGNETPSWLTPAAIRETVESVIVAFVLAFLFRTFEAEAFVIPTGSMAPTLMGKHKDVDCPMCGYRYPVSASDRNDVPSHVYRSTCPMCRFTADLERGNPQGESYPSFDGDRILVAKFPYDLAEPKRWDVIVFKYPNDATQNYIKRLVGLPGETISIDSGDLWLRQPDGHFEIARKPPEKIRAMLQPVYDNDLAPKITGTMHWPARWTAETDGGKSPWSNPSAKDQPNGDLSSFEIPTAAPGEAWIRYRNRVPTPELWQRVAADAGKRVGWQMTRDQAIKALSAWKPNPDDVPPQLIADFTAYNTSFNDMSDAGFESVIECGYGRNWVGDLALGFELDARSTSGKVSVELIKGGRPFRCRIDLANGDAEFSIGGDGAEAVGYHRTGKTTVVGTGHHDIVFANVDDELTLWVDGKVATFTNPAAGGKLASSAEQHPNGYNSTLLNDHVPTVADLSPAGIAADGAAVKVSHIKVMRDIYYIAEFYSGRPSQPTLTDFKAYKPDLGDPKTWPMAFARNNMRSETIVIAGPNSKRPGKDRFFVLGDNSAQSSDGRLWKGEWWVDRDLLIGKALFIYWPHGWPIPYVPLPFNPVPNFPRMRLVR